MKNEDIVEQYIANFNPYENRPSIGIDLVALTRYAKANNKKPEDMCIDFEEYKKRKEQENYDIEKEAAELVAWIDEVLQLNQKESPRF